MVEPGNQQDPAGPSHSKIGNRAWGQFDDQVRDQVGRMIPMADNRSQVWGQVMAQAQGQVRDQVAFQTQDRTQDRVDSQVWDQVDSQVWDQIWEAANEQE